MRTTIEIEDGLLILAKKAAAERRCSVRALVEQGLRRVLKVSEPNAADPIKSLGGLGKDLWKGVDGDRYVREAREEWS